MYIAEKLLIDIERKNNSTAYYISSEECKEIETIAAGKMIITIPENEHKNKIYKLLEENCDLYFCTTDKMDDFLFYPVPMLAILAVDSNGFRFGTIGGMSDIESDDYPVGYINREGRNGKIASNLKEFLELVTFYPYWSDIIKYEQMGVSYDIGDMDTKKRENVPQYFAYQRECNC